MEPLIYERVRQLLAELLELPESEVDASTARDNVEAWDSLQHLNLMMAIEDAFAIELMPEELEATNDVGAIVELLEAKGARPTS